MEAISDSSDTFNTEMSLLARRRLANMAVDLEEANYGRVTPVEVINENVLEVQRGLKQRIIGQDEVVDSIVSALECADLRNPERPISSFLFLGPTGVGKSATAKELSRLLHGGKDTAFLKIDCTELTDDEDISVLLGAPPKYVGREQAPRFAPGIIEQDKSVILFDEIEKGPRGLEELVMQILEEGTVTLHNGGEVVSFKNSIIILTSNVGSSQIMQKMSGKSIGFKSSEPETASKESIENTSYEALKKRFSPEFINRIDHRITFNTLNDEHLAEVLDNYVFELSNIPKLRSLNTGLTLAPEVIDTIVSQSAHRDELGARPVLRRFEQTVWRAYVRSVTAGDIPENSWTYAMPAKDDTDASQIPVEFHNSAVPAHPETREVAD